MEIILNILLCLLTIVGISIGGTIYICSGAIAEAIEMWIEEMEKK